MDTNYIKQDGFSNPTTERLFNEKWHSHRGHEFCRGGKHCGLCSHAHVLIESPIEHLWYFCLNDNSEYFLETVHFAFGCTHQEPSPIRLELPCPWLPPLKANSSCP